MIVARTLAALTALFVLGTATAAAVIAAAFALFFVLEPAVGRAGAAALVAGVLMLVVSISVMIAAARGHHGHGHHGHDHKEAQHDFGLMERVIEMVKDKPILTVGAALAAGLIAIRNPALVATIVAAFVQPPKHNNS